MSRERLDPAALRAALSDPRAVARALGLERGAVSEGQGGIKIRCPAHGDRTPSMSLRRARDGTLSVRCYACGWGGDVLALVAEVERLDVRRDFPAVLARAAELAGGAIACRAATPEKAREEAPRLDPDIAAELFARVCARGRLGERGPVEAYLARRGLLEAARAEGWASLPSLAECLDVARGVWQEAHVGESRGSTAAQGQTLRGFDAAIAARHEAMGELRQPGAFAFAAPEDLLVAARLARRDRDGRLRLLWGEHRLVIPWRGPDGRIQALQRRLIRDPRKPNEPRYVATWVPKWPYGAHRLCIGQDRLRGRNGSDCVVNETSGALCNGDGDNVCGAGCAACQNKPLDSTKSAGSNLHRANRTRPQTSAVPADRSGLVVSVAFVEGAIDALALGLISARAGRAGVVLGLPGTGTWESSWAGLARGRKVYFCHDGRDPNHAGDFAAARCAVACAEADGRISEGVAWKARRELDEGERLTRNARAIAAAEAEGDLEEVARMLELGWCAEMPTPRCILCGASALWLCGGCGRRRARGKDWGADWERRKGA